MKKSWRYIVVVFTVAVSSLALATPSQAAMTVQTDISLVAGASPQDMLTDPNGYVWAADDTLGMVHRVSVSTNTVVDVPTGAGSYGLALTPDGSKLFVANYVAQTISVIDPETPQVTSTINLSVSPLDVAVDPSGQYLYYVSNADAHVFKRDISSGATTSFSIQGGAQSITLTDNGTKVVVSMPTSSIGIYSTSSGAELAVMSGCEDPFSGVADVNSHIAYIPCAADGTLAIVNTSSNSMSEVSTTGTSPRYAALSPDGSTVAVADMTSHDLVTFSTSSGVLTQKRDFANTPWPTGVAFASDGASVWVSLSNASKLAKFTLTNDAQATAGGSVDQLSKTGGPNWVSIGSVGVLLSVAGALTLLATRRRTR